MRLFSKLYEYMLYWAKHRHAVYYLAIVSFLESSVFPIPPDVMLAPMALAHPQRAFGYASITTIASVLGAILGYVIGRFFFDWASPLLHHAGYWAAYEQVQTWFTQWGGWVLFIAGFSPIPFKLFTIAGGALHMSLPVLVMVSLLSRGMRFYLVAGLMRWGGPRIDAVLKRYVDRIGWLVVTVLVLAYLAYRIL